MEKSDYLIENFKNIQDLIKFTDQKAAAVFVVSSVLVGFFVENAKNLEFAKLGQEGVKVLFLGGSIFIVGLFFILLNIYILYSCLIKILKPKFAKHYNKGIYSSFYFEHISKESLDFLRSELLELSKDKIAENLTCQIYEISHILTKKNRACSTVMNLLFGSLLVLLFFIFLKNLI